MHHDVTRRDFLRRVGFGSVALALGACQPATSTPSANAPPATTVAKPGAAGAAQTPEAITLPIVTQPLTLTYWAPMSTNVAASMKSFGEMGCYTELEKRTGIHLDFQHPPLLQEQDQFNLLVASGKYPDVVEFDWLHSYAGGPAKAIKDGVIIRLNDPIDQYAPNLKKVLTDHPEWRKQMVTDEGDIYCFPFIRSDPLLLTFIGPVIRADWLDKLSLKVPTTLDEWHTMLKAFKDQNANGKGDTLPFSPWLSSIPGGWGMWYAAGGFLRHAFVGAWGIPMGFYQVNGTVMFGALQPEFQDFTQTMRGWFGEGLIDPDFPSTDQGGFDQKVTSGRLGSMVTLGGNGIGKYLGLVKDPTFKLVGAPYPVLKAGDKAILGQRDDAYAGTGSVAITTANKHVAETIKEIDYGYSDAGHLLFNFGIEGVSYTMESGNPLYTPEVMRNPQGLPPAQAMSRYIRGNFNGPFLQDVRYLEQYYENQVQKDALKTWLEPSDERQMPPVTPTQDESKKFASIMTDVNSKYQEVFTRVVTGAEPMETLAGLPAQLRQIGVDDAVKIQQAALDRYNKRA
jgi:putative aldouronate transport system substrate-binding protein